MYNKLATLVFCSFFLGFTFSTAQAANTTKKKNKKKFVDQTEVISIEISYKLGKRKKELKKSIQCLELTPGLTRNTRKGLLFTSFKKTLKKLRKKRTSKKFKLAKARLKAGKLACKDLLNDRTPESDPTPEREHLSLAPFNGEFTAAKARTLYERFAFGGSYEEIEQAVAIGLNETVNKLTTPLDETELFNEMNFMKCHGYTQFQYNSLIDNGNSITPCDSRDPNAFRPTFYRYGIYRTMLLSPNPFFHKLLMFLHDERMSASFNDIGNSNDFHTTIKHYEMLRDAAFTGDYKEFMREWNQDELGHLLSLDGAKNIGETPNENYAREFWELGTVGTTDLDGNPIYNGLGIAQAALAFSGWELITEFVVEDFNGRNQHTRRSIYHSEAPRHAEGLKTIFQGTPYEARVEDYNDMLEATFAHPRTAEHLAEDIWKEFINLEATPESIRELAAIIRANNFNLIPVMQVVMKSKAVHSTRSRKTLIKHPVDLLFGLYRQTTIPVPGSTSTSRTYAALNLYLNNLGQQPLLPESIFGWDEAQLAGEAFVFDWRNTSERILDRGVLHKDERGNSFESFNILGEDIQFSEETVERVADILNVNLNALQKGETLKFLDYRSLACTSERMTQGLCDDINSYYLVLNTFVANPRHESASHYRNKFHALIGMLVNLPDYRMK